MPEVRSLRLCAEDEFVLLASDGLWDVVDPATAVAAAREELRAYGETTPYTPPSPLNLQPGPKSSPTSSRSPRRYWPQP